MILIGLCGPKGSGKSTVASLLEENHEATLYAFADYIKEAAEQIYGFYYTDLWGPSERRETAYPELGGLTPRKACEEIGELGRKLWADTWLTRVAERVKAERPHTAVISDVRHINEAKWVIKEGGYVLEVCRAGKDYGRKHPSDFPLPDHLIHKRLDNNGSKAETALLIEAFLNPIYDLIHCPLIGPPRLPEPLRSSALTIRTLRVPFNASLSSLNAAGVALSLDSA